MKKYISLLLILISFAACKKEQAGYENKTDVAYGTNAAQKMDIYIPPGASATNTKLLVLIHGGSWISGDKADFNLYLDSLKKRLPNYAIANINYRLYSAAGNKFPAQEEDIQAAIKYLMEQSGKQPWSQNFILLGASAGAHLALLQGYKHAGTYKPKAIVSLFAPVDLTDLYNNSIYPQLPDILSQIVGAKPTENPTAWKESSPIYYVTSSASPTIIFHGQQDILVPFQQATLLSGELSKAGVPNKLVLYPTLGHGWEGADMYDTINKAIAFIQQQVP